ncbi:MAG: lyase [Candidatus Nitrosotenuis sp.]
MKTKTKGIIVAGFFAVILVTSTLTLALKSVPPPSTEQVTITDTPADNFPDNQRPRFCGTGDAKSNAYVSEFKIPTTCTQPLAITVDPQGTVWFAQTNTGKIAKFDPTNEYFTEYPNPMWPELGRSMIWGMDYSYDGNIWYTDDAHDSIWRFSTADGSYQRINYPANGESLPQHLMIKGSQIILNDFYGGKISFFDTKQTGDKSYQNIPTPIPGSFVSGFDVDSHGNVWYTNWILRQGGALVKFNYNEYTTLAASNPVDNSTTLEFSEAFNLPPSLETPIGLSVDHNDNIWIADTSSNSFFKFTPSDSKFTRYLTSDPRPSAYGNTTGVIKSPVSGPYWTEVNNGKLIFNEQIANAIAVFNIDNERLVEYQVPSQNPNWADCAGKTQCGIAQVFGFKATGDKVWFTEWVENNIGVVDLAKELPFEFEVDQREVAVQRGQTVTVQLQLTPNLNTDVDLSAKTTSEFDDIAVELSASSLTLNSPQTAQASITTSDSALPGTYKILLSARTNDVTISNFITVNITP